MSITKKMVVGLATVTFTLASAGAFAQDRYGGRYDQRDNDRYDRRDDNYDSRYDRDGGYDYARVVDVEPLMTRVRVSTPERECWDETRVDERDRGGPRTAAGGAILGAVIGGVIGHQIGSGRGRDAATAAGAVIGAGIGSRQAQRNANAPPPSEYTVQRCDTRYSDHWEERIDAYRVTYVYNGRRQVTQLPYKPGERIRVRVDVSPAD
ncbi:MAG TPA: glycine zipper 2TM domain-containing protein [Steroidobacteraceae bacterium]|nr:glycine zipper 2TM domain-containing protein [Steroidobacteraceae bacterium]